MPVTPEQHEHLARTTRDIQAILTAHTSEMEDVADEIVEDHLDGDDGGDALLTLMTMEALHYLHLYAQERGVSVETVLAERGQRVAGI